MAGAYWAIGSIAKLVSVGLADVSRSLLGFWKSAEVGSKLSEIADVDGRVVVEPGQADTGLGVTRAWGSGLGQV